MIVTIIRYEPTVARTGDQSLKLSDLRTLFGVDLDSDSGGEDVDIATTIITPDRSQRIDHGPSALAEMSSAGDAPETRIGARSHTQRRTLRRKSTSARRASICSPNAQFVHDPSPPEAEGSDFLPGALHGQDDTVHGSDGTDATHHGQDIDGGAVHGTDTEIDASAMHGVGRIRSEKYEVFGPMHRLARTSEGVAFVPTDAEK